MTPSKAAAVSLNPNPSTVPASLNPKPGILGATTWKACCAPAPKLGKLWGSVKASIIFWTSMNEEGQLWQKSNGMAFLCLERLCTKCMRRDCVGAVDDVEGRGSEEDSGTGTWIAVRNCGSDVLKCDSCVLQE